MNYRLSAFKSTLFATLCLVLTLPECAALGEKQSASTKDKEATSASSFDVSTGFASAAEKAIPSVVNVSVTQIIESRGFGFGELQRSQSGSPLDELFRDFFSRDFFDQPERSKRVQGLGSGFIMKVADGFAWIVTNYHVVADAKKVTVILHDKNEAEATVIAYDMGTDLAILKININDLPAKNRNLRALEWGDSSTMRPGDWIMACGNPYGLSGSVSAGIVSSIGRDIRKDSYVDYIQHDASINMGNSGGPLMDPKTNKVVGVNTMIYSPSGGSIGIGFAIPADTAKRVVFQLLEKNHVTRGFIGVRIQAVTPGIVESLGLTEAKGAFIGGITEDGPAAKAGLKERDVILSFNGKEVNSVTDLSHIVRETDIGKTVKVGFWREGKVQEIDIIVAELPNDSKEKAAKDAVNKNKVAQTADIFGLKVGQIPPELRDAFRQQKTGSQEKKDKDKEPQGILILAIDPSSKASESGLREGDRIIEFMSDNKTTPINTVDEFIKATKDAEASKKTHILLKVGADGEWRFIAWDITSEVKTAVPTPVAAEKPEVKAEVKPAAAAQSEVKSESKGDVKEKEEKPQENVSAAPPKDATTIVVK